MPRPPVLRHASLLAGLLAGAVALGAPAGAGASCGGTSLRAGLTRPALGTACISVTAAPNPTTPGGTVQFTFSASAPIQSYDVDWNGDGTTDETVAYTGASQTVDHVFLRGRAAVSVQAIEAGLAGDRAFLTITATGQPTASLTAAPTAVKPLHTVSFDASASTPDAGGALTGYEWDFEGDGAWDQVTTAPTTTHVYPAGAEATLQPRVRITNDLGATATAAGPAVVVHNARPSATFTPSSDSPRTGQLVSFDAAGSSDPDGDPGGGILEYRWDLDGNGSYERTTGRSPTVGQAYPNPGRIVVGMQVRDDAGALAVASRTLTVTGASDSAGGTSGGGGSGAGSGSGSGPGGSGFTASLTGAPIQRLARALRRGVAFLARANRRASGKLVVSISARDARRLRLSRRRGSRPVTVGTAMLRLAPGRTARPSVRLTRRAARALRRARSRNGRLVVSAVVKDAGGHRAGLSRVVLLRR